MKSLLLDANVFLRFLLNDIPSQQKISADLLQLAKSKKINLIIPQIIIFEIEFILSKYYLFPKKEIIERLQIIVSMPYLDIQDKEIFQKALTLYKDRNLSLTDCFLKAKSEVEAVDIFTFDRKLSK